MDDVKQEHMGQGPIVRALGEQIEAIRGHLDLEGICYIKLTRTSAQGCFASDATSDVLKEKGMSYHDQQETFWKKPASVKFGTRL
jgi:hypothetical protein